MDVKPSTALNSQLSPICVFSASFLISSLIYHHPISFPEIWDKILKDIKGSIGYIPE